MLEIATAADDTGAGERITSVATDSLEDMVVVKNTLLLQAQRAWAEAARLYERTAELEDDIVAKLKEQDEEWGTNAASAESCRRLAGKLNGES